MIVISQQNDTLKQQELSRDVNQDISGGEGCPDDRAAPGRASRSPCPIATAMRTADRAWRQERAAQNLADTRARADRAVPDRPPTRRPLTRAATGVGSSVAQDRQVELTEARGVGDHVDLDDLPACDREIEYEEQPTMLGHDDSYGSVHESRSRSLSTS